MGRMRVWKQHSGSRLTQQITFRVRNDIYLALLKLALEQNISPHEVARRVVINYLRSKGLIKKD